MGIFKSDPFSLMTFHRVLISTAVAGAIFYGIWELVRNGGADPAGAGVRGGISFLIAFGLIYYLWRIRGKK